MTRFAFAFLVALAVFAAPRHAFADDEEEETLVSADTFDPSTCGP